MIKRFRNICKYILLVCALCINVIACGSEKETEEDMNIESAADDAEDVDKSLEDESVTVNVNEADDDNMSRIREEAQSEDESIPDIEIIDNCIVEARIHNEEEYEGFVNRLEEFTGCHYLWIDLGDTDTTIYLDEILDLRDFEYLQVRNGGNISARDMKRCAYFKAEIELSHVFAIDEDVLRYIASNDSYGQSKIVIELDNRYRRKLPIEELLNYQNCTNVILVWDDDTDSEGLLDVQEDMESLREWDYLQSVQEAEGGFLKAIYRLNDVVEPD